MIKGCSNYNCAVKTQIPGQHTSDSCRCVQMHKQEADNPINDVFWIEICGTKVGPDRVLLRTTTAVVCWLRDGGLRDILKLAEAKDEINKKGEEGKP